MRINSAKLFIVSVLCFCLSATLCFAAPKAASKTMQNTSRVEQAAQTSLLNHITKSHVVTGREGLSWTATTVAENGSIKVSFMQTIDRVPVDGPGLSVYMNAKTGKVHAIDGDFLSAKNLPETAKLEAKSSLIDALGSSGISNATAIATSALVYSNDAESSVGELAWRTRVMYTVAGKSTVRDVYVNAVDGKLITNSEVRNQSLAVVGPVIDIKSNISAASRTGGSASSAQMDVAADWLGAAPMDVVLPNCANDSDRDCLNDDFEDWIGHQIAPIVFYDEDESCVGGIEATFRGVTDDNHYDRKDFFQVRPRYYNVANWNATDGKMKTVVITYLFAYPHDCQTPAFGLFGGHQGDIEKVQYTLQTRDFKSWSLVDGSYRYHKSGKTVSGKVLREAAVRLGVSRPLVASSEGSHASYFTNWTDSGSSLCDAEGAHAKSSLFGIGIIDDCFCKLEDGSNGSPYECYYKTTKEQGRWINLSDSLLANVGEPDNLRLGEFLQMDDIGAVFTEFDLGHGAVREYWSEIIPNEEQGGFCGWECPNSSRIAADECAIRIHGEKKCVGSLRNKMDRAPFSVEPLMENPKPLPCKPNMPKQPKECEDPLNPK